jgi:hypothetical protein
MNVIVGLQLKVTDLLEISLYLYKIFISRHLSYI